MRHLAMLLCAASIAACGSDDRPDVVPIAEVAVGACGAPAVDSTFVQDFRIAPCTGPHAMEVAGRYELDGAEHPGSSRLRLETQKACIPIFTRYVNRSYWQSDYELRTISPSKSSWAGGDRSVLCLVVGADGAMLESYARGSAR